MKIVVSYIIIFIVGATSFLPGQGFAELHKIPVLIEHYKQHQQEENQQKLSFTEFLMMHYGDTSSHKQEENHEDLPLFHTCCVSFLFIAEKTEIALFQYTAQLLLLTTEVNNEYSYSLHHTIFQPPRLV